MKKRLIPSLIACLILTACSKSEDISPSNATDIIKEVDPSLFIPAGLVGSITKVEKTLSNGTTTTCYKITTTKMPSDHAMGPWCPTNLSDDASKGGVWFEKGNLYDVDGAFVKNLATFYNDAKWKLYNSDGSIKVTNTKEACQAAARPDVDPQYNNYCVECQPSYFSNIKMTYYIPVKPIKLNSTTNIGGMAGPGGGSVIGIAFNGVNFDPPAPTQAILGAYTLAPMDDAGGHVNGATGYHYHAATGKSKKLEQADGHAAMIGYALDGFGMYELMDKTGKEPSDLDACRGHYDATRGYHYHVAKAGSNSFIGCFHGAQGTTEVSIN
ncbi:YHYH protein [Aquirufa sp. ROCK-SH2]